MSGLLSRDQFRVLSFCEEHWLRYQKFPIVGTISRKLTIDPVEVVNLLSDETLQKSLEARGIPWMDPGEDLTPKQIACIQLILNVSDDRLQSQKLRSLGITPAQFQGWKKNPVFKHAYNKRAEELFGEALPEIHSAVISMAKQGDMKAVKVVYGKTNYYNEKQSEQAMNVKLVLIRVLEAIQKHVSEPDVLNAIASEFNGILLQEKLTGIVQGELE